VQSIPVEPHRRSFQAVLATNQRRRAIFQKDWLEIPDSGEAAREKMRIRYWLL
jgi:hypothetical protein